MEGERRHLTVMFCDLVGSTPLAERLDPEELRAVIGGYQELCVETIGAARGYIANYLGDGLMVYFGYPQAREDDPQRAIRAGLEILARLPGLNATLCESYQAMHEVPLRARIGIHSGLVVAGEMGGLATRGRDTIVGEAPNLAARLQEVAPPDSVVISAMTEKLVRGFFNYEPMGRQRLKGVSAPIEVYRVIGEIGFRSRFEVVQRSSLTPLVGRDNDLARMRERWNSAKDGTGQVVLLSGEPGIGKSRLVHEMAKIVEQEGAAKILFRCSPDFQNTAFHPVIEQILGSLQDGPSTNAEQKIEKLERNLRENRFDLETSVPLLAALLSLPIPDRYPSLGFSPQAQKQKTIELLVTWLTASAAHAPLLSVWEDLHWVDPSTLELLDAIIRQAPEYRTLMVLTFRPEFAASWNDFPHVTRLTATRLLKDEVENVLTEIAGGKSLPPEVVREIVDKTDGVPLFIEELTRMVVESDLLVEYDDSYKLAGPLPPLAIPATLHDSLMARLDRIPNTRRIAQQASTIGREFRTDLLRIISRLDPVTLRNELDQMITAELVYLGSSDSHQTYVFKHALIHETAYHSLLRSSRQQYHQRIAAALEQEFPETVETQPELLAHHFMVAGLKDQSIFYWERAAERAIQRSANKEAIAHLKQAIDLLMSTAETPERAGREVVLQSRLGVALMLSKGYTSAEVQQAFARARELCRIIGDTPRLYPVLWGLWAFYLVRAEYNSSIEIGSQLLALAEEQNDSDLLIEAHTSQGLNFFYRGELNKSQIHLEQGLRLYDADAHRNHALVYGQDPAVASLSTLMWNLWIQGYPDQAAQKCETLLRLANETGHQYSLAYALSCAATFRQFRREVDLGKDVAERGIALSNDQGFLFFSLAATYTLGWALGQLERGDEALKLLRPATETWRALGSRLTGPHQLGLLADVLARVGLSHEAHQVLNQALEDARETGEEYYEAELNRLKGEVFLIQPNPDLAAAEAAFARSIEVAQRQGAKSWELRTSMSLARLWRARGRGPQAAKMLSQIYGWFSEGLATRDLVDARALLAELG